MSCDFQRRMRSFSPYSLYDIYRRYQRNILEEYHDAWDAFEHIDNILIIKSCEQEIIKLDKIELQHSLQKLCICITNVLFGHYYISKEIACVLFHLINVFCTPGQEEKMRVVQVKLNEVLHTVTEEERCHIFEKYISQRLKAKLSLTEIDMFTGKIDSQHDFQWKLFYWDIFYSKYGNEGCKEFLKKNADFLVSKIEERETNWGFMCHTKFQLIACNILLCLLNWNICKTKKPVILQKDRETPAPSSGAFVADTSTNYSFTAYKVSKILYKLLSTLSEDIIITSFNNYLKQMYAMNSEITEDDFCTGKIEPYYEFLLKLCYCEKLMNENDNDERCKEFLTRNADLFVSQIKEVVLGENTNKKLASCKVLLCLLNWNICNLKSTFTQSKIQNSKLQESYTFQSEAENTTKSSCKVRCVLQNLLSTLTDVDISQVFWDFIEIMHTMKSEITPDGLSIGETDSHHEFKLKLFYWWTICKKNNYEAYVKFIQLYPEVLVSHIQNRLVLCQGTKTKHFYCRILLFILNPNICTLKKVPLLIQKAEKQASSSLAIVADSLQNYYCTAETVRSILQNLLSTSSEEEIIITFKKYLGQLYTMNSEITDDELCTGKIDPYYEFLLKLCHYEKLCKKNTVTSREFLKKNANMIVSQIEILVGENKIKWKTISCAMLLCILKLNMHTLKTTPPMVQNTEMQACSLDASVADTSTNYSYTANTLWSLLETLLSTLSEDDMVTTFNNYLGQLFAINSEITEDDLCTGKMKPYHEFMLKLCYCEKLCNKNDATYKEFLRINADMFVSQIEILVGGNKIKWKTISGTLLLCLLKFNMCTLKTTPLMVQNKEIQACSSYASVADTSTKYSYTANTLWSLLETLLSTLSEDDMFTTFKNYLGQLYVIKSEITEDDLYTGKMKPYHEFMLKLCYCEKLCIKKNENKMKKFLSRNAEFLVSQIEEGVNGGKTQLISCKVLLCLSKWGISNQNTAYTSHEDIFSQTLTFNTDYQDFINENALFFLSMVGTVMNKNTITVLINLCDVLLCISHNGQHFHDVIGAVNKLIRYYATQVGMNKKILEWIIKLRYRVLRHLNDNQKLDTAIKIEIDFQNLFNLLDDLLTNLNYNSKPFKRANNSFKSKIIHHRKKSNTGTCFTSHYHSEEEDEDFASHYHSEEEDEDFASHYHTMERYEDYVSHYHTKERYEDIVSCCQSKEQYENFASHYHTMELFETRLRELWIAKIKCKVKATQISNKIRIKGRENLIPMEFLQTHTTMSEQDFMYEWKADLKENQLNIKTMEAQLKEVKMVDKKVDEIRKTLKLYEMLVLFMMTLIVMVGVSNGHHKSAKLKKYLSLKYEYATASLYLLWCSGDIEVHPGPSLNKKSLAHDSNIERRWIQNSSPKIINRLPEHEQSKYKPTKKVRNDSENREHFKSLLKTCQEEQVHVPKMYLDEINAWETKEYKLLHKLFVYRCEIETIIASLKDFLICGGRTNELTAINISFDTELQTNEITKILGKDHRPTDKSQQMVYITRYIAGILIKCAHGKDPNAKCDGLWDLPLKKWPKDIILFDPNNRGKYSKKYLGQKLISDQELVDNLIALPQVIIPPKYKPIMDAFRTMRKSQKDKLINKQHKAELCSTFKRITSLEKLDYALKNLWESGIFTEEVHNNLNKWWTTGAVDTTDDQNVSQVDTIEVQKRRRPHILINISTKSITLTVEQTDANSSHVSFDFPFSDQCVPLKTMATSVYQTTIQKLSSDSYQMVTAQKYFTVSSKQDACPVDNQTYSIIVAPLGLNANSQAILESDIRHQHKISTEETALCSTIDFDQSTSSTKQISQLSQIIANPASNQSTTNSDDISSATKDSQSLHFHTQVSPTSDIGSSDSISSVNSKSGNDDGDQTDISNGGQVILTDSDYSSDSSNNFVSKTNMEKRKFKEEDSNETKKRKIPSQEDKKPKETNHRQMDCLMDNTASFDKNSEILPDWLLDSDLDSYNIDDQTFKVDLNALDNEDTELVKFLQDMINCESEKNVTNEII